MTEFRRLLESSSRPATRDLLRSGLGDRPRRGASERAALALGLTAAVAATSSAASTAAAAAVTSTAVGSANAAGTSLGALGLAKWLAMGMTAGVVAAGSAAVVRHEVARGQVSASAPASSATYAGAGSAAPSAKQNIAPSLADGASELRVNTPVPRTSAGTARSAASDPAPPRPPQTRNPTSAQAPAALAREVAQIDAARHALASGDPTRALAELERYERIRETPTFVREAEVLRIEAFSAQGERTRASELARRYLKRFPNDAHVAKLREQFGAMGSTARPTRHGSQ